MSDQKPSFLRGVSSTCRTASMAAATVALLGAGCLDLGQPGTNPSGPSPAPRQTPPLEVVSNAALLSGFSQTPVFQRPDQPDRGALRLDRQGVRGRGDRPHLVLRQPFGHHRHRVRRPARRRQQLLGSGPARLHHRPELRHQRLRLRAVHPRPGHQFRERHVRRQPQRHRQLPQPARRHQRRLRDLRSADPDHGPQPSPPGGSYPVTAKTVLIDEWPSSSPATRWARSTSDPTGSCTPPPATERASTTPDWGQFGNPKNPLGDPPGGVGAT